MQVYKAFQILLVATVAVAMVSCALGVLDRRADLDSGRPPTLENVYPGNAVKPLSLLTTEDKL